MKALGFSENDKIIFPLLYEIIFSFTQSGISLTITPFFLLFHKSSKSLTADLILNNSFLEQFQDVVVSKLS